MFRPFLCRYLRIAFTPDNLEHESKRRQIVSGNHGKNSGSGTGNQHNTLLVLFHRLLSVSACNVPKNDFRKFIPLFGILLFGVFEIAQRGILYATVKLHIGDNDQFGGKFALGNAIVYCGSQDEVKNRLNICIPDFIERASITEFIGEGITLQFDKLRAAR